jgi:hypothetical protein
MSAYEDRGWCDHCDRYVLIRKHANATQTGLLTLILFTLCCFPLAVILVPIVLLGSMGDSLKPYRCTSCGGAISSVRPVWEYVVGGITLVISAMLAMVLYAVYNGTQNRGVDPNAPQPIEFRPARQLEREPAKAKDDLEDTIEVPVELAAGKIAKIMPTNGEPFVRLLKSRKFFDRWHKAIAANDEAELLRITGDPSDPVFGVAKGESVSVIEVDRAAKVARVKVTTGSEAGKVGFVPFADLDAGTQRVAAPTEGK